MIVNIVKVGTTEDLYSIMRYTYIHEVYTICDHNNIIMSGEKYELSQGKSYVYALEVHKCIMTDKILFGTLVCITNFVIPRYNYQVPRTRTKDTTNMIKM